MESEKNECLMSQFLELIRIQFYKKKEIDMNRSISIPFNPG